MTSLGKTAVLKLGSTAVLNEDGAVEAQEVRMEP